MHIALLRGPRPATNSWNLAFVPLQYLMHSISPLSYCIQVTNSDQARVCQACYHKGKATTDHHTHCLDSSPSTHPFYTISVFPCPYDLPLPVHTSIPLL